MRRPRRDLGGPARSMTAVAAVVGGGVGRPPGARVPGWTDSPAIRSLSRPRTGRRPPAGAREAIQTGVARDLGVMPLQLKGWRLALATRVRPKRSGAAELAELRPETRRFAGNGEAMRKASLPTGSAGWPISVPSVRDRWATEQGARGRRASPPTRPQRPSACGPLAWRDRARSCPVPRAPCFRAAPVGSVPGAPGGQPGRGP